MSGLMNSRSVIATIAIVALAACTGTQNADGVVPLVAPDRVAGSIPAAVTGDVVAAVPDLHGLAVRDLGIASPNAELDVAVTFRYRNAVQLEHLIASQADVLSLSYHHWLTNDEFDATYAPLARDYNRAIASLHQGGLRITKTFENRTVIDARGTVAQLQQYFHTSIHRIAQRGQGVRYANVRPAYAPRDMQGLFLSVDGLSTVVILHSDFVAIPRGTASQRLTQPSAKQSPTLLGPFNPVTGRFGYAPAAFAYGYDYPSTHSKAGGGRYDGLGRSAAIVIDADYEETDLTAFMDYFKELRTGPPTVRVNVDGGGQIGVADQIEATLDVQQLVSNAPGVALRVYEFPTLATSHITDAFNQVVADNKVDVATASFGGCDVALGATTVQAWSAIAEQGVAKGITFAAASGDGPAYLGDSLCPDSPASSPYFVGVGGTSLNVGSDGTWASETAWGGMIAEGSAGIHPQGSGGGISSVFAFPTWQHDIPGTIAQGRNVPDVAFDANPLTGAAFYIQDCNIGGAGCGANWYTYYNPIGGTSVGSPLFAASVVEIDEVAHGRVGLGAGKLYTFWKKYGYGKSSQPYFHDITQGDDGIYYAGKNYDLITGIGSPDVWNIAAHL